MLRSCNADRDSRAARRAQACRDAELALAERRLVAARRDSLAPSHPNPGLSWVGASRLAEVGGIPLSLKRGARSQLSLGRALSALGRKHRQQSQSEVLHRISSLFTHASRPLTHASHPPIIELHCGSATPSSP